MAVKRMRSHANHLRSSQAIAEWKGVLTAEERIGRARMAPNDYSCVVASDRDKLSPNDYSCVVALLPIGADKL